MSPTPAAGPARRGAGSWRSCSGRGCRWLPSGENRLTIIRMLGDFFFTVTPAPLDQVGQDRLGQRHAVLHQHLGHVQIDASLNVTVSV